MAAELEKLARQLKEQGYPQGAQLVNDSAKSLKKAGLIPAKLAEADTSENPTSAPELQPWTELDLDAEWQRQAQAYVKLGYHTKKGMTEEAYLDSLPKFQPQPEKYIGRLNLPLLVEKGVPWEQQAQLAGIVLSRNLKSQVDLTHPRDDRAKTPDFPYTGWFNIWGLRFTEKIEPIYAINQLAEDECGGGPFEGVAIQIAHPELTRNRKYYDLIGYTVGFEYVPSLDFWDGGPRLHASWRSSAQDDYRPLIHGDKIATK